MILTLCLNPTFDVTLTVSRLTPGALNRVLTHRVDAGGKGLNVALGLSALGLEAVPLIMAGEENAPQYEALLRDTGISRVYETVPGRIRTNTKVMEENGTLTELNGQGPTAESKALEAVTEKALELCSTRKADTLVCTGSLPPGCPADYYRLLMEKAAAFGTACVLDADGEALREGLKANPVLIKPNLAELERWADRKLTTLKEISDAAMALRRSGIAQVAVSLGGDGALLACAGGVYYGKAPRVKVLSTVGAGDAMLCGLLWAARRHSSPEELLKAGIAAGSAAVSREGTQPPDPSVMKKLMDQCEINVLAS